jgi:hypothetical protein
MAELETDYIAPRRMFGDDILAQNIQSNQDKALSKFMLDINPKIEVGNKPDNDKACEKTEKDVEHPDIGTHVTDYRWIQLDQNRRMLQAYERNVIANYNAKEDHYQWYSQTIGTQNVEEKKMEDGCYYYLTDKADKKGNYNTYEKVPGRKCNI